MSLFVEMGGGLEFRVGGGYSYRVAVRGFPECLAQLRQLLWDGRPDTVADGYPSVVFDYLCMSSVV